MEKVTQLSHIVSCGEIMRTSETAWHNGQKWSQTEVLIHNYLALDRIVNDKRNWSLDGQRDCNVQKITTSHFRINKITKYVLKMEPSRVATTSGFIFAVWPKSCVFASCRFILVRLASAIRCQNAITASFLRLNVVLVAAFTGMTSGDPVILMIFAEDSSTIFQEKS